MHQLVKEAATTLDKLRRRYDRATEQQKPYERKKGVAWHMLHSRKVFLTGIIEAAERRLQRREGKYGQKD